MEVAYKKTERILVKLDGQVVASISDSNIQTEDGVEIEVLASSSEYPTLAEIEKLDCDFIIPRQAAGVLGCAPYTINCMATREPESLGFPVTRLGTRVKIPRLPFIRFVKGEIGERENA